MVSILGCLVLLVCAYMTMETYKLASACAAVKRQEATSTTLTSRPERVFGIIRAMATSSVYYLHRIKHVCLRATETSPKHTFESDVVLIAGKSFRRKKLKKCGSRKCSPAVPWFSQSRCWAAYLSHLLSR